MALPFPFSCRTDFSDCIQPMVVPMKNGLLNDTFFGTTLSQTTSLSTILAVTLSRLDLPRKAEDKYHRKFWTFDKCENACRVGKKCSEIGRKFFLLWGFFQKSFFMWDIVDKKVSHYLRTMNGF